MSLSVRQNRGRLCAGRRVLFLLSFGVGELCVRLSAGSFFRWGLLFGLLSAGVWALLYGALCESFSARVNRALCLTLSFLSAVFYGSQIVYHTVFSNYYTLFSLFNGAQVFGFMSTILRAIGSSAPYLLAVFAVPVLFWVLLRKKQIELPARPRQTRKRALLAAALLQLGMMALLLAPGRMLNSPFDVYFHLREIAATVESVGLAPTMRLDALRLLTGSQEDGSADMSGVTIREYDADAASEQTPDSTANAALYGRNALDIDFEALAAGAQSTAHAALDTAFAAAQPSAKNEMTGLFQGKNLILITAEGFSPLAIDPVLTPTLHKLSQEGFQFENFYTPLWGVSTLDGEYVALTGLIPKTGVWSLRNSSRNTLPYVLGNQFAALGYNTLAYHDHDYTYYGRNLSHPNLGYDYKGLYGGLDLTVTWPESDLEMIDETTDAYLQSGKPFHVYYLTVSGHLNYTFDGNAMATKNRALVEDLAYSEPVRAYLACQIEFDRAMGLLLKRLEAAGELENTVIAISADHYPYGLKLEEISELAGHTVDQDFELYKNVFLLYNAGTEPVTVTRPCSSLDILPTLSNLFGLSYDSRLLMGSDVFGDADPLVIFANRSWITDRARYSARLNEVTPTTARALPAGYVQEISDLVAQKFQLSAQILDTDYYAHVQNGA